MANDTNDIRSTLNGLIETCKDGETGFRESAQRLTGAATKSRFETYATQRADFASQLQGLVSKLGGEAETSGSTSGGLHRGWINLKAAITGNDDHAILEEAERGEDVAVKNYRDAMAKDFPSDIRAIIEKQFQTIQQTHNEVKMLRDTGKLGMAGTRSGY
jgi:uncharacterized protein (TIGR02284 family)